MNTGIVISGIGLVSPLAVGREPFWDALFSGKNGFRSISLFDASPFNVRMAGEITDFDPLHFLGKKGLRDLDRSTRLLSSAARLALEDSGIEVTEESSNRFGVSIGSTFGSIHSISQFDRAGLTEGPRSVNPSHFPNTVINSPSSQVSIRFKIKGFNTTISTGFCASLDAVSYAADFIRLGRADAVLAGGAEELCEETFMGFYHLGFLSGMDRSEPLCCPYDSRRNGTVLSEGAAVLALESGAHAEKRGASILCRVAGYGSSFDPQADRSFADAGSGLANAVTTALKEASLKPEDIDYICSCANGTKGLDSMETRVIKGVFGPHAYRIPVSAIKSMLGESYSASGSMALAAAVGAIQRGMVPPTLNYRDPDPLCDLDYVPGASRQLRIRNVLVLAADPFGQNTAVVLGRNEATHAA